MASEVLPPWRPLKKIYLVWADRANGLEILCASLAATLLAVWALLRTASPLALLASSLAIAFTLLLAEAALIYPEFTLAYHSFMMFVVLIAPAVALQAALDAAASVWRGREPAASALRATGEHA